MMTRIELLAAYAARGWSTFPVRHKDKRPLGGRGHLDASVGCPIPDNCGVALNCELSRVVVIDLDPRNGGEESWRRLVQANGVPKTPLVSSTGGGGAHILYRAEGSYRKTIGNGIDVQHRGYIVLPPSLHPSGWSYDWTAFGDLISMPSWLSNIARRPLPPQCCFEVAAPVEQWGDSITSRYGEVVLKNLCTEITRAVPGVYNNTICSTVFKIWQYVGGGEIAHDDALQAVKTACEVTGNSNAKTAELIRRTSQAGLKVPKRRIEK